MADNFSEWTWRSFMETHTLTHKQGYIKGNFQEASFEDILPLHDDEDYDGDNVDYHEDHDDDDDELFCLFQTR